MHRQLHADQGTFVQPHQAALIFDPDQGWSMAVPYYADEKQMPSEVYLLALFMLHAKDPAWVDAMLVLLSDD